MDEFVTVRKSTLEKANEDLLKAKTLIESVYHILNERNSLTGALIAPKKANSEARKLILSKIDLKATNIFTVKHL